MAIGAVFAWAWTPDVQVRCDAGERSALQNITLEDLGEGTGRESVQADQRNILGFRNRWKLLRLRRAPNDD
jgi:hypothetical protein